MPRKPEINIGLLPFQMRLFNKAFVDDVKYCALIGGTGCGKTYVAPRFAHLLSETFPGEVGIISAPTFPMLKRNPWAYTEQYLKENKIPHEKNKTELVMYLPNAKIYFIPAETPDRMQGIHAKWILGDEAGLFPRLWWDTAVQRTAFKKGKIFLFTTPYTLNWLKTEFYDKFLEGDPNFWVENPKSIDNPYYPRAEYDNAKANLPDWKFKLLFEGIFTKPAGLIYPEYEIIDDIPLRHEWLHYRGLDWGWVNEAAVVCVAEDPKNKQLYVYKERKKIEWARDEICNYLSDRPLSPTYCDVSHTENNVYLKGQGINQRDAVKDVLQGIGFLHGFLKSGRLKVFRSCVQTIDELNTYQWQIDKSENFLEKPVKQNDHLLDALRYCIFTAFDQEEKLSWADVYK